MMKRFFSLRLSRSRSFVPASHWRMTRLCLLILFIQLLLVPNMCHGYAVIPQRLPTTKIQPSFYSSEYNDPYHRQHAPLAPSSSSSSSLRRTINPWSYTTTMTSQSHHNLLALSTTSSSDERNPDTPTTNLWHTAVQKFRARPVSYLLIPCIAAIVGWFTNYLAVQMIFYPIQYWGIPLFRRPEVPLGLIGWQGIIPCKTRAMTHMMVDMVTNELLSVSEAFRRLDPHVIAKLLAPETPHLAREILVDIAPRWMTSIPGAIWGGLDAVSQNIVQFFNYKFLKGLAVAMQQNAEQVFNIHNCVVTQMMNDRGKLGELFQICGKVELDFLTNSGLWFGFLLGIIQMMVALFWSNPWSLSIGGGIVGLATNWLALKWIFEPVDPTKIGPFVLQGKFLRRQKEVAAEFSKYFANHILTGQQIWHSILTDTETRPAFARIFGEHLEGFVGRLSRGLFRIRIEPKTMNQITERALDKLPNHVPVLFPYMDRALGLEQTLRTKMEAMTSRKFERVLHPIFEEDELTLIIAGAVLGFLAGLVQQGIETGSIVLPDLWTPLKNTMRRVCSWCTCRFRKKNERPVEDNDGTMDDRS